jgi:hypothetical protein
MSSTTYTGKLDWWDKKSSTKSFPKIKLIELTETEMLNAANEVWLSVNNPMALSDEEYLMIMGKVVQQLLKDKNGL